MVKPLTRCILSAVLLAGVALSATPALSQARQGGVALTIGPVRVEFVEGGELTDTVSVFVRGGTPGRLVARMYDAVLGEDSTRWQQVEFGSTPHSLAGFLEFTPESYPYRPAGEQEFTFTLTVDPAAADKPRWGKFIVTLEPDVEAGAGEAIVQTAGAIQVVGFGPVSPSDLRLQLDRLSVTQATPWTTVDRLLPQIPGVIGHGPAFLEAAGRNAGEAFLDERTVFEIRRVSPLSLLPWFSDDLPGPILRVTMRPHYLLPGQTFVDSTLSYFDREARLDALPFIGFVRVTAIATGKLSALEAPPVRLSKTLLVFPWSEFLFLLVVYLAQREWRHRKGRAVNTSDTPPPPTLRTRVRETIRKVFLRSGRSSVPTIQNSESTESTESTESIAPAPGPDAREDEP